MRISWRFVGALLSAAAVVVAHPQSQEAWSTAVGIVLAALSTGFKGEPSQPKPEASGQRE